MTKPKPIKPFKTLEEEAEFWDTHELTPAFVNPKIPLDQLPPLKPEKQATATLRLQPSVKQKITQIAHQKGINFSTLSRMWLIEKLRQYQKQQS